MMCIRIEFAKIPQFLLFGLVKVPILLSIAEENFRFGNKMPILSFDPCITPKFSRSFYTVDH